MAGRVTLSTKAGKLTVTAAILASGLGFLMNSAVTIALPRIQEVLDRPLPTIQWVVTAYVLTLSAFILVSGAIGDLVGRKRIFNIGIAVFTLGALASGAAPTLPFLIAFRAIQGCGAALMVPGSLAIISVNFPKEERGRVIGLWAGISGAIAALGPLIGGLLVELSWRLVFLSVVPLGVAAFVASALFVPESKPRSGVGIDVFGAILVLCGLFALSLALVRLPDWGLNPVAIAVGTAGIVLLVLFVLWESRTRDPIMPHRMFTRHVAGANISTFLLYFAFQSVFFLLSYLLQQLLGLSSGVSGFALLPTTIVIAALSGVSGTFTDRHGSRPQMVLGPIAVTAVVLGLLFVTRPAQDAFLFGIAALAMGFAMVIVIPAITKSALDVEERYSGAASGVNNALARVAGLVAVALQGALLVVFYRSGLSAELAQLELSDTVRRALVASAGDLLAAPLPEGLAESVREGIRSARESALSTAFRGAFAVVAAASAGSALVAWFTIERGGD